MTVPHLCLSYFSVCLNSQAFAQWRTLISFKDYTSITPKLSPGSPGDFLEVTTSKRCKTATRQWKTYCKIALPEWALHPLVHDTWIILCRSVWNTRFARPETFKRDKDEERALLVIQRQLETGSYPQHDMQGRSLLLILSFPMWVHPCHKLRKIGLNDNESKPFLAP